MVLEAVFGWREISWWEECGKEWVLVHALLLYARRFTGRFEISRDG